MKLLLVALRRPCYSNNSLVSLKKVKSWAIISWLLPIFSCSFKNKKKMVDKKKKKFFCKIYTFLWHLWHLAKPILDMVLIYRLITVWRSPLCFFSSFDRNLQLKIAIKSWAHKIAELIEFFHHFLYFFPTKSSLGLS